MQQHTEGMIRNIIWVLLEICLAFQQWKDFKNPLRNDEGFRHEFGVLLFWDTDIIDIDIVAYRLLYTLSFCSVISRPQQLGL